VDEPLLAVSTACYNVPMDSESADMPLAERMRLLETLPASTPLSIQRAAWLAGYRSSSTLKTAVSKGRLHVERHGPRLILTTAGALRDFLATLSSPRGTARGQLKGNAAQAAGEDTSVD